MSAFNAIVPVVLAAGDSVRMGYPKALLPLESGVFLSRILDTVHGAGLGKPTVVLGRAAAEIQARIDLSQADVVINPAPDRGQLSSIQLALASLQHDCIASLIWPVDQPLISESLIASLANLFLSSGALIANPVCRKKRGHPVIFRRDLFEEFLQASLEENPKKIVARHRASTVGLPTEETGTVFDIDTPSDYEDACGESLDSVLARTSKNIS